ncbi:MAG: site-2 protease family protein [Candidatus Korarchaeota archaeon]
MDISLLIFIIVGIVWTIGWYLLRNKKKDSLVLYPFVLGIKTAKANGIFERIGKKIPRKTDLVIQVIAAVLGIIGISILTWNALLIFIKPQDSSSIVPLIPGVTIPFSTSLLFILVGIGIALVGHEMAHGAIISREKVPIRSSGIFIAGVLGGGFVEPDEDVFNKIPERSKRTILAAGSVSNLAIGVATLGLVLLATLVMPLFYGPPAGVYISNTVPGSPADGKIPTPSLLVAINNTPIRTYEDLSGYLDNVLPGEVVVMTIVSLENPSSINVTLVTGESPTNSSHAYIGISGLATYYPQKYPMILVDYITFTYILRLLVWIYVININVAIVNMVPIPLFDGMRFFESILKNRKISNVIGGICLTILLINVIGSGVIHGWRLPLW